MNYIDKIIDALHKLVMNETRDAKGVHAETAIATLGGLSGAALVLTILDKFPSVETNKKMISEKIDTEGKHFFYFILASARQLKLNVESIPDNIPKEHQPRQDVLKLINRLQSNCWQIFINQKIPQTERLNILALAIIKLIKLTADVLEPSIAMSIAFTNLVKVAKMKI